MLSIEHRAAASPPAIELAHGGGLMLHVRDGPAVPAPEHPRSPAERVLDVLAGADVPLIRRELRDACRRRNVTFVDALAVLQADGRARVEAGARIPGGVLHLQGCHLVRAR